MTLHPDFTGILDSFLSDKYQTLRNHTCEARARIITAFSSRPADGPSGPEAAKAAVAALQEATAEVMRGNPATTESALAAQAEALDVIFREYARIAALNTDICSVQTYMRFALKAQAQCRVTIETLERTRTSRAAAVAKPLPEPRPWPSPAEESKNASNELLRRWLDVSARTANSEKSPNELLKAQLLSGVSAASLSPGAEAHPIKSENSTNELLPDGPAAQEPPQTEG